MNTQEILDALLNSGKELVEKGKTLAEAQLNVPDDESQRKAMLDGAGKGALAAGVLALLLGTRTGRKLTGTTLKLGSLAAIGGVAYKAFESWKNQQTGQVVSSSHPVHELNGEKRSRALLKAMIAAAKADGHIDEKEKELIAQHAEKLGLDSSVATFIAEELAKVVDAKDVAAEADSPEAAAEFYLISRLIINSENDIERKYIEELAKELNLAPELIAELDEQVIA